MSTSTKKHSEQVLRTLRVIELLAGHEFEALSTGDVATALHLAKAVATRTLAGAAEAGWLEQTSAGRWRHSEELSRLMYSVQQMQPCEGAPAYMPHKGIQKYLTPRVQSALRVIELLAGRDLNPLRTCDIARLANINESLASIMLQAVEAAGFAIKTDDGKWKMGRAPVRIAIASTHAYQKALSRIENQINNRTRSAW